MKTEFFPLCLQRVVLLAVTCIFAFSTSHAQNAVYWQGTGAADWSDAANWLPNAPDAGSVAHIKNSGTAVVGGTTFDIRGLMIGESGTGALILTADARVSSTSATSPTQAQRIYVGKNAGDDGTLILQKNAYLETALSLTIGEYGTGRLPLSDSAMLISNGGYIGLGAGGHGTVTVEGSAFWDAGFTNGFFVGAREIGDSGTGFLTIQDSGTVRSSIITVGGVNGFGQVEVKGNGTWITSGMLLIGDGGTGLLEIRDTGKVVSGTGLPSMPMIIGGAGSGTVAIYGNGVWDLRNNATTLMLGAGALASANLNINDQGSVLTSTTIVLGSAVGAEGVIDLNGGVLEAAGIRKGNGTAVLNINSGTLRASGSSSDFISGIPVVNIGEGGAGIDTGNHEIAINSTGTGAGGVTKTGPGRLIFNTIQDYTGATVVKSGALVSGTTDIIKSSTSVTIDGAFELNGHDQQLNNLGGASTSGAILLSTTNILTLNNTQATEYSGGIRNSGTVVKTGAGTLTLKGVSTFGGETRVTEGTLKLAANNALGSSTIENNSVLEIATGVTTFSNTINGAGRTDVSSTGVSITGTNTNYSGTWNVTGNGTVQSQDNLGADAPVNIASGGQLTVAPGSAGNFQWSNTLTGSGTLTVKLNGASGTVTLNETTTGTNFHGTLKLNDSYFVIDSTTDLLMQKATVAVGAGNTTEVAAAASGTRQLGGLTLDGGLLYYSSTVEPMAGQMPTVVKVDRLTLASGSVHVDFKDPAMIPSGTWLDTLGGTPLLQQDEGEVLLTLVEAGSVTGNASNISINGNSGTFTQTHNLSHDGVTTDAVATYDYKASTGAANNGLHIAYGLTQLDLVGGRSLTLDHDDGTETGSTMDAQITGAGSLVISASGWIALSNTSNAYTGTTTVASGTLKSVADNALGATSELVVENGAAYDLGEHYQKIGAFTGKAGSMTTIGTGTLEVMNNSESRGSLHGGADGNLIVNSPTFAIYGANGNLHSKVTITEDASVRLDNANGLGDGIVDFAHTTATLTVANAANGIFSNTLAGPGRLVKENTGTLTISHANYDFDGAVHIKEGRLVGEHIAALNTASVNVETDAVFELSRVTGTLGNTITGSGTFAITNNSRVTVDRADAIGSTLNFNMDASEMIVRANGMHLGNVYLNGSRVSFASGAPKTMTIDRLDGENSFFSLNVDFDKVSLLSKGKAWPVIDGGVVGDFLQIAEASSGEHGIDVVPSGNAPAEGSYIELVRFTGASDDDARYHLVDMGGNPIDEVDLGLNKFILIKGTEETTKLDDNAWYLKDTGRSSVADAIIASAAMLGRDWHYAMDSMHQRMGEIRMDKNALTSTNKGNVWIRGRGYQLSADKDLGGLSYDQYGYGVTAGGDRAFNTKDAVSILGAFADIGAVSIDLDSHGESQSRSATFGIYASWLHNNGWYLDAVLKMGHQRLEFDAKSPNGLVTTADDTTNMAGLSLEFGRRVELRNTWWVEPSLQLSAAWFGRSEYDTTPDERVDQDPMRVQVESTISHQYRFAFRAGRQWRDTKWHPYGKLAFAGVFNSGGEVTILDRKFDPEYDGLRVEAGLGVTYSLTDISQVYFGYEYAKAENYDRPWAFNLGYRILW